MKTFVVIPTLFKSNLLDELIQELVYDSSIDKIYILNNSNKLINYLSTKIQVLDFKDYSIYEMWNRIWEYIRYNYPKQQLNIAFLNDDIVLKPYAIDTMRGWLRLDKKLAAVYPDYDAPWDTWYTSVRYTESTAGAGGMSGYCFMIKGELDIPYIDENLKLYWGDDDLVKQISAKGYKIGRIVGLPIKHEASTTIKKVYTEDARYAIMEQDRQYFNKKYGESREPVW